MRKIFLGLLFLPAIASAQFNYKKLGVSLGGGVSYPHMDVNAGKYTPVFGGRFQYNISPFADIGLDIQAGSIESDPGSFKRPFTNKYFSTALTGKIHLAQFIDPSASTLARAAGWIYAGTGLGLIKSKVSDIDSTAAGAMSGYDGADFLLPVNAGVRIPVLTRHKETLLSVFLNYRMNVTFSDALDGYEPVQSGNTSNDFFSTVTLGVAFNIGPTDIYMRRKYN